MANPTIQPVQPPPAMHAPRRKRRPLRIIGAVIGGLVLLGAGIGIGATTGSNTSQLNADKAKLGTASSQIAGLRQQVSQLQSTASSLSGQMQTDTQQLAAAQSQAAHAVSVATATVKAQDAARQAQLNSEAATLKSQQAQLAQQQGVTQNNQISQDGVYVIGRDMKGGTWHTSGGSQCYYALLGSTDTSNIIDNNNITGPATVSLGGAYAFDISGGCTWVKIG
jgi:hypothetical protein